jgi:hypothetical protein
LDKEVMVSNRRWIGALVILLALIAGGTAIGVGAYHAGFAHGLAQHAATSVVYAGGAGFGFFPFGIFLFPLFFILLFMGLRFAMGGRRRWDGGGPGGGHGPGGGDARSKIEEWHRREHEGSNAGTEPRGDAPSGPAMSTA